MGLVFALETAETVGHVISVVPNSHGLGAAWPIVQGEAIPVYYYPRDPSVAVTAPAGEILKVNFPSWIIGSLFGCLFGVCVALRRDFSAW